MLFHSQKNEWTFLEKLERTPYLCALLSALLSLATLAGIGAKNLAPLQNAGIEIGANPLILLGFFFLSLSLLATLDARPKTARIFTYASFGLGTLLAVGEIVSLAPVSWTFLHDLRLPSRLAMPLAEFLCLAISVTLARQQGGRAGFASSILAILALGLATVTLLISIWNLIETPPLFPQVLMSPAGALCSVLLASGILAFRWQSGWPGFSWSPRIDPLIKVGFPAIIAVPVIMLLISLVCVRLGLLSYSMACALAACGNVVTLSAVFFWSAGTAARSQAALRQAAEALDLAPVIITDSEGIIIHWSEGCERLYGWNAKEAVGKSKYELLQSRDQGRAAAVPAPVSGTTRTLTECTKDGHSITTIEEARLVTQSGHNHRFVLSITEISALIATTTALRESETRLELALEAHAIGIYERNCRTGEITWAPGSEERLGLTPGQIDTYDAWANSIEPEDFARISELLSQAIADQAPRFSYSFRLNLPNGTWKVMEGSSRCIYDGNGELVKTVGVSIDVTNRFEVGRALRTSHEQFQSVLETAPSALIITDEEGAILSFSKSAEHLFGYAAHEMIGQPITLLTREGYEVSERADSFTAEQARTASEMRTLTARHRNGSDAPVQVWVREFGSDGARLFTIFMRDITEKVLAEERLYDLRDDLAHVARVNTMGEVAAGIAHEINQPLSAMTNFLGAAKFALKSDEPNPKQLSRLVEQASEQAIRAGNIIRRMRQFVSRGDMEMQPVPISKIIEEAIALASLGSGQHDIELDIDIPTDLPRALADRVQIEQVLVNLLRNAIDELREQPRDERHICVRVRHMHSDMVEVRVEDNGPGLSDSVLDQLYAPFSSSKKKGMGLGLSICRRIVEAHGGTLTGENKTGGGAVFRFTLPVIQDERST